MLQVEQIIDAAIAADLSLLIKCISGIRIEPGTSHTESSNSTTELLQNAIPVIIGMRGKATTWVFQHFKQNYFIFIRS